MADRLGERYTGRHVDKFFITYGPPVSKYALSSGDKFYTWRSGVNSVTLPGSSNFSGSVNKYGQIQSSSSYTPQTTFPIICEIRLLAAAGGTVKRIDITRRLMGDPYLLLLAPFHGPNQSVIFTRRSALQ